MIEKIDELANETKRLLDEHYVTSNNRSAIKAMAFLEAAKEALWLAHFHASRSNESDYGKYTTMAINEPIGAVEAFDNGVPR